MRASDAERDNVVAVLQRAYQAGRIDLDELLDRQERALVCRYTDELAPLVADLPERDEISAPSTAIARADAALPATGPEDLGFSVTIMSGRDVTLDARTRHLSNFAWWGGNDYDLTRAMGPGRVVTLNLHSVMGGSNIVVPPGVRVVDQSLAIMAGNNINREAQGDGSNGTLILRGFLWWAGNEVKPARGDR